MTERIISLLPSATEVLWFLGHGDRMVGVTFECDHPREAASLPHVTDTIIEPGLTPGEIDAVIKRAMADGEELYRLDRELLASLDPDLIVSQDLCRVCALPYDDVDAAVRELGCDAEVFSYDPMTLDGVLAEMAALDRAIRGESRQDPDGNWEEPRAIGELRARLDTVRRRTADRPRPKVLLLEWPDPPFTPGHWIPDQIVSAGGDPVLAHPGQRSEATDWETVAASDAEILLVAPCGFDEAAAREQLTQVVARSELADLPAIRTGRTYAIDADSLIVRPGPRLIEGVEALAALLHPEVFAEAE